MQEAKNIDKTIRQLPDGSKLRIGKRFDSAGHSQGVFQVADLRIRNEAVSESQVKDYLTGKNCAVNFSSGLVFFFYK